VFRAPASYTRQDIAELHVVGSPPFLALILDQLLAAGARAADPGEFTARAFLNGAMDLTRVEGVATAIAARSDAQLRASRHLLQGGLGRRMSALREALADLLARVEAEIDFVEESMGFVSGVQACGEIERARTTIHETLAASITLERIEVLPEVVLIGRPNAGKSTLFNRLTGTDRAIRSALAGTTRDVLRAPVHLPRGDIVLVDSAGVSTVSPGDCSEPEGLDAMAQAASLRAVETADLLLLIVDISQDRSLFAMSGLTRRPAILVGSKRDLVQSEQCEHLIREAFASASGRVPIHAVTAVSAVTGEGVHELTRLLDECLFTGVSRRADESVGLTVRQHQCLRDAESALLRAGDLVRSASGLSGCAELMSIELREAISALSLLTGDVTNEDLLGRIFSRFCIGK
jgi:tRNA modification GTPase